MPFEDRRVLEERVHSLESEVAGLRAGRGLGRGIRRRSRVTLFGLPVWDVALGPSPDGSSVRGHARGLLAVGDLATGVVALGGLARGLVALGGVALGAVTFGGLSLGLVLALGGAAVGGVAIGGGAAGGVAVGGAAAGVYAMGGAAGGSHVVSPVRRDPEAVALFERLGLPLPPAPGR